MKSGNNNRQNKKQKRRLPNAKRRKHRLLVAAIIAGGMIVVLPAVFVVLLWWKGLLPTREELPRYKERVLLMLQGWRHTRLPEGEVIGIDISHYQSAVDYDKLMFHLDAARRMYNTPKKDTKPRSVDFVVAKATEGSRMRDSYYRRNKQGCREHDILFGAYHFYSLQASATEQANNYIQYSQLQRGDILPVVDIEPIDGRLPELDSVRKWLQIVGRYYGVHPIIYTNENTYRQKFADNEHFRQYPFWIARYGGQEPSRMHAIWQCTENGKVGGISGPVDIDVLKGTKADMNLYLLR